MAAPTATVIAGVSLATDGRRHNGDRFDLALSPDGLEIRRPGQAARRLSWDAVSEWEIEDRRGGVLLTLRGRGAVTPLHVPRWTVDELAAAMRDATGATEAPAAEVVGSEGVAPAPAVVTPVAAERLTTTETGEAAAPVETRQQRPRKPFVTWKVATTVSLLAVLAAAVTLVLLQSAGVIDLSFLGPTA